MTGRCCESEGPWRPLARRVLVATGSLLPGALLAALPKCPLCLAAWLAAGTGAGVSGAMGAGSVGLLMAVFWVAAMAVGAGQMIRRRGSGRPAVPSRCLYPTRAAGALWKFPIRKLHRGR